jgi:hypothetical protein
MQSVRMRGTSRRALGGLAALAALVLLMAACGQKPGVRDEVALGDGQAAPSAAAGTEPGTDAGGPEQPTDGGG